MRELSNDLLYDISSQGASELPQLEDLDFPFYLIKADFLEIFNLNFGSSDAP